MMYSIGQMAKKFALSRSTLLYYDKIGLLKPSERSSSNYRLYTEEDYQKMVQIDVYRQAGMPLKQIISMLVASTGSVTDQLEGRLAQLNYEIQALRKQQQVIVKLLKEKKSLSKTQVLDKNKWIEILRSCGMSEEDMWQWHIQFEKHCPEGHQDFLESLGIKPSEIQQIRKKSRLSPR